MVFPVIGGDGKPTGYEIDNSLRFNNPDDPNLSTTFGSAGNRRTFTISAWVKRGNIADDHTLFGQGGTSSGNPRGVLFFANSLRFTNNTSGSSTDTDVETNAKTRDPSAWYHAVVAVDTTQGTNSNRVKLYLNGELQTSLATTTYPDQNFEMGWNNNVLHTVGRYPNNDAYHMDGYISEFYFIDGTQYAASDFGETNDNGVWIPKDAKGDLTFGTNGFYLEFQQTGTGTNASGMGADTSGNDNHLAVNNLAATDVTTDTPTNNFCTFNPLDNAVLTLSEGNTKATHSTSSGGEENRGTMGFANGKWYWEFQIGYDVPGNQLQPYGIGLLTNTGRNPLESDLKTTEALTVHWYTDTSNNQVQERIFNTTTTVNASESYADNGDIVQFAIDADAGKVWVGKNNTYLDDASGNVGDPANGNYPIHTYTVVEGNFIFPAIVNVGSQGLTILLNTGNPSFAISSGNADANGYGNFEHAPPSGFYSICSKNLAEYG